MFFVFYFELVILFYSIINLSSVLFYLSESQILKLAVAGPLHKYASDSFYKKHIIL